VKTYWTLPYVARTIGLLWIIRHRGAFPIPNLPPPSADVDVAKLRLELNEKSLEELVEAGVVKWDREENVVKKGPHFDKERPLKS